MRHIRALPLAAALLAGAPAARALDLPRELSAESAACVKCHRKHTPGVVHDWLRSRHAWTRPESALEKPAATRRLSVAEVPGGFAGRVVGCFECHGQRPETHSDSFDHLGYRIHVVVTPRDCETCHPAEAAQFGGSGKARARESLAANPLVGQLIEATAGGRSREGGRLSLPRSTPEGRWETCDGCHGTEVAVRGLTRIATPEGELEVPDLAGWPNQGAGRVNPDGSRGACTPCHARHAFSLEEARHPEACAPCHQGPHAPAAEVYRDSRHGSLYAARELDIDWENVPWVLGRDFTVPTCAACHGSLVVNDEGATLAPRSHDFGARLWVPLLGIRAADAPPGPEGGPPAARGPLPPDEQKRRRDLLAGLCGGCHGRQWVEGHFRKLDATLRETDAAVVAATGLLREAWDRGLADPANAFDEAPEKAWAEGWLFHATAVRYASAMAGSPSHATFRSGWWDLNRSLAELEQTLKRAAESRKP